MKRDTQAGFTMIEVMISVLITAIAALGFIAMYMTETRAGSYTRRSAEAAMLATDKLEQLRTGSASSLPTTAASDEVNAQGIATVGGTFTRRWIATPVDGPTVGETAYYNLLVQVGWNEDENVASCATDSTCTTSKFCLPSGTCAGRAVIVNGKRGL